MINRLFFKQLIIIITIPAESFISSASMQNSYKLHATKNNTWMSPVMANSCALLHKSILSIFYGYAVLSHLRFGNALLQFVLYIHIKYTKIH